jgi:hypothetical protein
MKYIKSYEQYNLNENIIEYFSDPMNAGAILAWSIMGISAIKFLYYLGSSAIKRLFGVSDENKVKNKIEQIKNHPKIIEIISKLDVKNEVISLMKERKIFKAIKLLQSNVSNEDLEKINDLLKT